MRYTSSVTAIGLMLLLFSSVLSGQEWTFVRGDVDGEGNVALADSLTVLNYLFAQTEAPPCLDAADFDDNGALDLSDGVNILRFVFANGAPPAAPYPECGPDPTSDSIPCPGPYPLCPAVPDPTPSNLVATAVSDHEIHLTWQDNTFNEIAFQLERSEAGGPFEVAGTVDDNITSFADTGLTPLTEYCYRVRAIDAVLPGDYSNVACATTDSPPAPTAPTDLTATAVNHTIVELEWTDTADNEFGFEVERLENGGAFMVIALMGANTTFLSDQNLDPATEYCYRVRAVNDYGSSAYADAACATTFVIPPPQAPSELSAVAIGETEIQLSWQDNAEKETGFEVERADGGAAFRVITALGPNTTALVDSDLTPEVEHCYRVRATNEAGFSEYSNEACDTPEIIPPGTPLGLMVSALPEVSFAFDSPGATLQDSRSRLRLSWIDNSGSELGFVVERSPTGESGTFERVATAAPNATVFYDSHLEPATTYCYRVGAQLGPSNVVYAMPVCGVTAVKAPPHMPSGLFAATVNETEIALSWADNSFNEEGFEIERSVLGGPFAFLATVGPDVTDFVDTHLEPGVPYCYQVRAFHADGESPFTGQQPGEGGACEAPDANDPPPPDPAAPHGPDHLNPTVLSPNEIVVTWRDNSRTETTFEIERSLGGGSFEFLTATQPDQRHYYDDSVEPDRFYCYRVRAVDGTTGLASPWTPTKCRGTSEASISVRLLFDSGVFDVSASGPHRAPGQYGSESYQTRLAIDHFDWTSPVDFAHGKLYNRVDVLERPSLVQFQSKQVLNEPGIGGDHWWPVAEWVEPEEPKIYQSIHLMDAMRDATGLRERFDDPPELRMHFAAEYQGVNVAWNDDRFYPFEARFAWVAVGVGGIFPGWGTLLGAERPQLEPLGLPYVISREGPVQVTMTTRTRGSEIRYTLNGSEPSSSSTLYQGPIEISTTTTIKARTFNPGIATSDTTTMRYVID